MRAPDRPLLVYGPRSTSYDFGPNHPLTPRRFGPGIDLLRVLGAEPGLDPAPASDEELLVVHQRRYLEVVRRFSASPLGQPEAGIGPGDVPAFRGMHEAGALVAGGSLRAVEAILRGEVRHAFHPGGGLHHAMPGRAAGFCIYNDPALAIARARSAGLRVLYVDLDVHHGDGVESIHADDPGVLTFSIHESGRSLFPGTGAPAVRDDGPGAATAVNLPIDAGTGAAPWLTAVERVVPELAASFGPDLLVTQHGCDSHLLDPLAHLRLTTDAISAAARLMDRVSHRYAAGRWLATGGGGYDVYRVVPRAWALVWLAQAHEAVPPRLPAGWRERWQADAAQHHQSPLPERFGDDEQDGADLRGWPDHQPAEASATGVADRVRETTDLVRRICIPGLIRHAVDAGWWTPGDGVGDQAGTARAGLPAADAGGPADRTRSDRSPADPALIVGDVDAAAWPRLRLAPRCVAPADPGEAHRLVMGALRAQSGAPIVTAAVADDRVVGLAISARAGTGAVRHLLAVGVAPAWRGEGLGRALLVAHLRQVDALDEGLPLEALITAAERDVIDPQDRLGRVAVAHRLLEGAGFETERAPGAVGRADAHAIRAIRAAGRHG
jgi:acetoin utilization protein AcuC